MDEFRLGVSGPPVAAGSAGDESGPAEPDLLEPDGVVPQSIYWRRRAIALVVGIGLLALLAWAVNGTLSSGAPAGPGVGPGVGGKGASHAHSHGHGHGGRTTHGRTAHGRTSHGGNGHSGTRNAG
jgi:hypothetical protein